MSDGAPCQKTAHLSLELQNKARAVLADEFGTSSADLWMSAAEDAKAGVFSSEEVYPYVSYSISVL